MSTISCCLKLNQRFASGIVFNLERGLILTIFPCSPDQFHLTSCTAWIRLGPRHNYSIFESEAEVLIHSILTSNNDIIKIMKPKLYLIVLKICSFSQDDFFPIKPYAQLSCSPICQGESVLVVGSPFGPVCPPVLLNNHFKGIVSKTYGNKASMLLIDTFCPQGLIGAPVFILKDNDQFLFGLLMNDSNGFNEFSSDVHFGSIFPVISIMKLLSELSILSVLHSAYDLFLPLARYTSIINPIIFSPYSSLIPVSILSRIVRLQGTSTYGTGIMVTNDVCITCAHVVADIGLNESVEVSSINSKNVSVHFFLSFTSKPNLYPDLAFLVRSKFARVRESKVLNDIVCNSRVLTEGTDIFGISYGWSTYSEDINSPLLTAGCVSNIVRNKGDLVFVQTSCCLSEGGSGGLVVDKHSFNYLGIFFGFAKEKKEVTTHFYHKISRFIPLQVIWDIWRNGLRKSCNKLERDINLQILWNYGYQNSIPNSHL